MATVLILVVVVFALFSTGISDEVPFTERTNVCAESGDNFTLSCRVPTLNKTEFSVKWLFRGSVKHKCEYWNDSAGSNATCDLTTVVFPESEGEYTCELTDPYNDEGHEQQKTNLQVGNCGPSTLVSIVDPSTEAVLDDPQYGSICVQSGSTRLFQCLIQSTSPCVYNISWMLGHEIAIGTAAALSPSSGGPMVNVSSFLSVQHPRNETRGSNLSCMATSRQECKSLNSTIRLTFCPGSEYEKTVIGVLISLCVAATIAALIAEVLIYKHYNG